MKKAILGLCLLLFSVASMAQTIFVSMPQVKLYADVAYGYITDMSDARVAVYDAREKNDDEAIVYMRRYLDSVQKVHPSIFRNSRRPSHVIILAQTTEEVAEAMRSIAGRINARHTSVVLLYGGLASDLSGVNIANVNAAFVLEEKVENPFDILSQAYFCGVEVALSEKTLALDNGRLQNRTQDKLRLAYAQPETVGMSSDELAKIDNIADEMISSEASPGAQIVIARHGVVVWSKCYGSTMYRGGERVTWDMLYDIASVSKVVGTLPVVMRMFDKEQITAETNLGDVISELDAEKSQIRVADLLQHQSGLAAGISTYLICVDSTSFTPPLYSRKRKAGYKIQIESTLFLNSQARLKSGLFDGERSPQYNVEVSSGVYTSDSLRLSILNSIDDARMYRKTYRYSDLNFIYLQEIAERINGHSLNALFNQFVARPMGLRRLVYRPLEHYSRSEIVPTENDQYFRNEQIWGTVHDQTAALLGGVAGNAGLFGNANEVAKIMQMYLWHGRYGGIEYVRQNVVDDFTQRHSAGNRRGYGFDKPERNGGGPVCDEASQSSFGHSGFSGTFVWADPEADLLFVFLSNRICPNAYNNKLTKLSIRSRIHQIAYKAICK